jgi:hypothetical protein
MTFVKNLQKNVKAHHFIALIGIVVLAFAIMQYSGRKTNFSDGFGGNGYPGQQQPPSMPPSMPPSAMSGGGGGAGVAVPSSQTIGGNEVFANVPAGSMTSTYGLAPVPSANSQYNPSDLLPLDTNSQWAQLNPAGSADFKNVNLLKAGSLIGIDTIGSSLRNANLQERSEPPNPTTSVSPWLNTTIEPDLMRKQLEIGTVSGNV